MSEIIGTLVLVLVVAAIFSKAVGPAGGVEPYLVGRLVWGIGLSGRNHRLCHQSCARSWFRVLRMPFFPSPGGGSDWGYAPIPVLGPLIGGAMAVC